MEVYRYPHYGCARPGTNVYEMGGHAYGGWRGMGDNGVTTPAAVAMVPEPQPLPTPQQAGAIDREVFATQLQQQARQAQANAITAAALNNPFAFAASQAAATAMATKAAEVAAGGRPEAMPGRVAPPDLPPTASPRAREARAAAIARGAKPGGMGRGIPWVGKTRNEKAATVAVVGGGGVGLSWMLGLL
jgi:hypothetical protein